MLSKKNRFHSSLGILVIVFTLVAIVSCGSDDDEFSNEVFQTITSLTTEIEYPISIYLPTGYENSTENFPVVYALDGQILHNGYVELMKQMEIPAILVSIHEGPLGRRDTDYLLPGAQTYYKFLVDELIPNIEDNFKAASINRTLLGVSNGGVMIHTALLVEDPSNQYFTNYVAVDTPYQQLLTISLASERASLSNELSANLILTSALVDASIGPFDEETTAFKELMEQYDFQGLQISRTAFDVNHFEVAWPSFTYAMELLFD